jgi:hypothetical protein
MGAPPQASTHRQEWDSYLPWDAGDSFVIGMGPPVCPALRDTSEHPPVPWRGLWTKFALEWCWLHGAWGKPWFWPRALRPRDPGHVSSSGTAGPGLKWIWQLLSLWPQGVETTNLFVCRHPGKQVYIQSLRFPPSKQVKGWCEERTLGPLSWFCHWLTGDYAQDPSLP